MAGSPLKRARREQAAAAAAAAAQQAPVAAPPAPAKVEEAIPRNSTPMDAEQLDALCAYIGTGKSLREWARTQGRDAPNVLRWIKGSPERMRKYRDARKDQAEAMVDLLLETAQREYERVDGRIDNAEVQARRLEIDTLKWTAGKLHPDEFGDRVTVDANVNLSELPPEKLMQDMLILLADNGLSVLPAPAIESHGPDGDQ